MSRRVVVIPGDGIGEEITAEAAAILKQAAAKGGMEIECNFHAAGGAAIDKYGLRYLQKRCRQQLTPMQCCLVRWVARVGMGSNLISVPKRPFWVCVKP